MPATVSYLAAPDAFPSLVIRHLASLRMHNYAKSSVEKADYILRGFVSWCNDRGIHQPKEVTQRIIERYQSWLFAYRTAKDKPLKMATQASRLTHIRMFFKWLAKERLILFNPTSELELPRRHKTIPRNVLSAVQVEKILAGTEDTTLGQRDRAILETLYATGIRRSELANLETYDIQPLQGTLMVRLGKGQKDRIVPISQRACDYVQTYQNLARPCLANENSGRTIFLSNFGNPLQPEYISKIARIYVEKSGIKVEGACHIFRHTMATLMLENGADTRHIQKILGHESLNTTQIYTKVSIKKLKEVHQKTHPGAVYNETS